MTQLILESAEDDTEKEVIIVRPNFSSPSLSNVLTAMADNEYALTEEELNISTTLSDTEKGQKLTTLVREELEKYQSKPELAPTSKDLLSDEIQEKITQRISEQVTDEQTSIFDTERDTTIRNIVKAQTKTMVGQTIDIPRIVVAPQVK